MKVRASLYFNSDVMVGTAVPDESHPQLHLLVNVRGLQMRLFLADEDRGKLSPAAQAHLPQAALQGHAVLRVFTAEADITLPPELRLEDLRTFGRNEHTWQFYSRLSEAFIEVHDRIRTAFNAGLKTGHHTAHALRLSGADYLRRCDARWLDEDKWRPLIQSDGMYFCGFAQPITPPDHSLWLEVASLLSSPNGIPPWHTLWASSRRHIYNDEYRLAIIDAITAVEAIAKTLLPEVLSKLSRFVGLDLKWIRENLTAGQLQPVLKRCLPILQIESLLSQQQVSSLLQGVKRRNSLIHDDPAQVVPREEALCLLATVGELISALEGSPKASGAIRPITKQVSSPLYSTNPMN
jgi:hypothetical protein